MRLLVAISAHGYGHAAQTAPVVNALRRHRPDLELILYTALPRAYLETRFRGPFEHHHVECDIGMRMDSAIDVRVDESAAVYAHYHERWDAQVAGAVTDLAALQPDRVVANVPYTILAAASRRGIPAIAFCSLNWADIYRHYCGDRPEAEAIHTHMLAAYRSAERFLRFTPGMPMDDLANCKPIGPVARIAVNRRPALRDRFDLDPTERLVLVGLGGIDTPLPVERWPQSPGLRWIIPAQWKVTRRDTLSIEACGMPFGDLLASSDALMTKPGYGSFTEAACNGIPVLYVERGDWPEEPHLAAWLEKHGRCRRISRETLLTGALQAPLQALFASAPPPRPEPTGIAEAVAVLLKFCRS